MKHLNEEKVLAEADRLYNVFCNKTEQFGRQRFDRTIGPRSTRAAILAIVRAINDAG